MYTPTIQRDVDDSIESLQWLDKAMRRLMSNPETQAQFAPFIGLLTDCEELKDVLLVERKRQFEQDEQARKAKQERERNERPPFGEDKPSESLHVAQGSLWC